jgi:glucose/arabinose dehydrogenase
MAPLYTRCSRIFQVLIVTVLIELLGNSVTQTQPVLEFNSIQTGLNTAVDIVNAGDSRLFVVQRTGQIRIISGGVLLPASFINLSGVITTTDSEQGLLSLAFPPNYSSTGFFFVYYTRSGDGAVTIARYQRNAGNANLADLGSGVVLLTVPKPAGRTNHNGGKLNFGTDGYLYFALGDGGGGGDPDNLAQDSTKYQGKMLRLDIDRLTAPYYNIPPTNPFVNLSPSTALKEIWAMGLRNPWRWSFDRQTHDMWIADVGQGAREEVNILPAGSVAGTNYGWPCYEGLQAFNTAGCLSAASYHQPIFDYPHNNATGGFAVTGGYVYRGTQYPRMFGYYIMADYSSGNVWKIIPNGVGGWEVTLQDDLPGSISAFGEGNDGELYAVGLNGIIYSVQANVSLPVVLSRFIATPDGGAVALSWKTDQEVNLKQFEVEYSTDAITFQKAGIVKATNSPNGNTYHFDHVVVNTDKVYYRLKMVDIDESWQYSAVISVQITGAAKNYIYPTIVTTGVVSVYLSETYQSIEIIDVVGKLLRRVDINGRTGRIDITLPAIASGACIVKLVSRDPEKNILKRIIIR